MSLRFCGCTLDVDAHRLFRGPDEVHLSPKAFETFRILVESRPRALSKTELLSRVWSDVIVSEVSLARVISEIRERIGDDRRGRIIRTVHSHGYAFVADVEDTAADERPRKLGHPAGWLISATRTLPLYEGTQILGRDEAADVRLDSPKVSRRHARLTVRQGQATVADLGSKNGTFVGPARIEAATPLNDGDELRIGRFVFVFRHGEVSGSTETEG
jgi:DNA-binding winged helix-turn-helix (wHTH) protein